MKILFKILASIIIMILSFIELILSVFSIAASLIGGIFFLIGMIVTIITLVKYGFSMNIIFPLGMAFFGFLVPYITTQFPVFINQIKMALKK